MSRSELVEAYQEGRISRRSFVKGMMALGVSVTVANAMADRVRAAGTATGSRSLARRVGDDDIYDDIYEPVEEPVTLPTTGIGTGGGGSAWLKPVALAGAGAAIVAGWLRKKTGEAPAE